MKQLTPRGRALRWLSTHRGLTEQPPGSNTDKRIDGIRAAQVRLAAGDKYLVGEPWCGTWAGNALRAGGVKVDGRVASVAWIEKQARAKRKPFRGWTTDPRQVQRGDLVVLFGKGVHVGVVRNCRWPVRKLGYIITDEGNTSSGNEGSQDNGGGSYRRLRKLSDVHGYALVDYPDQ